MTAPKTTAQLLELAEPLAKILMRCQTVLGNMALENEGAIFFRWPINHEPLRSDAKNLLPLVGEALTAYHQAFMAMDRAESSRPQCGVHTASDALEFCEWLRSYFKEIAAPNKDELTPHEANTIRGTLHEMFYRRSLALPSAHSRTVAHENCLNCQCEPDERCKP